MEILSLAEIDVEKAAKRGAAVLKKGEIVLFPTDTLYGLAVDATDSAALARLRSLKGREEGKPFSVIVPDIAFIDAYAQMNEPARLLAERFLPGALTLVLPANDGVPEELIQNGAVGIRIPDDTFCLALARAFGKPFTATSANRSGLQQGPAVQEILAQFGDDADRIDLAIDAGPRAGVKPSTIVSCINERAEIIREGVLSRDVLFGM